MFRCRNCGLYAHSDWTAAVIIRNRAYVGIPNGSQVIPRTYWPPPPGGDSSHPAPSRDNPVSA